MSYEVPLNVVGQLLHLFCQFLLAALAEDPLSGVVGLAYVLGRMKLAHRHQSHALRK